MYLDKYRYLHCMFCLYVVLSIVLFLFTPHCPMCSHCHSLPALLLSLHTCASLCCLFVCAVVSLFIPEQQVKLPLQIPLFFVFLIFSCLPPHCFLPPRFTRSFPLSSGPIREIPLWSIDPPHGSARGNSPEWWRVCVCACVCVHMHAEWGVKGLCGEPD